VTVFRALQDSPFTDWLLGSDSIWTYPLVLTLHTAGLAVLVGASVLIHLRLLNVGAAIPAHRFRVLFRFVWAGFVVNLVTGLMLFATQAATRIADPVFAVKLGSIALAVWVGVVVRRRAMGAPDSGSADPNDRRRVRWLAACGLFLWTVAIVTGRLMAYRTS
jgi:hypothetical protein